MDNYETYGATVGNAAYESHGYMQNLDGYQQHVKYSNYRDYQINPSMALWDMIKAPSLSLYLPKQMNSQENQHNSINKDYQTYSGPNSVEESRSGSSGLDTSPTIHHSLYGSRSVANSSPTSGPPHQSVLVVPQPVKTSMPNNSTTNGTGRKYQCKMCPQVFGSKADMQLHTQIHMREPKPYKCSQCSKSFANSSYLSQHTRIHLGIKPYRCEMCQRKFTQLSHLQQHIRTHTGDKPYKCRHGGCNKAFSQLSNLQSHSRCHQTDKPYKCNSCYKCFTDETALLDHIPKHKESKHLKTHICHFCGKSYTQETYLAKHMQKHADKPDKRSSGSSSASSSSASSVAAANAAAVAVSAAAAAAAAAAGLIGRSPANGGPESHYGWNSTSSANNNSNSTNNNSNNNNSNNNSASGGSGSNRDSTSSNNSATNGTSSSNNSPTKGNGNVSSGSNGPGASPDLHELSHSHPHHSHHPHHGHHHSQAPAHHPPPGLNPVTHHHQSNSCLLGSPLSSSNDLTSRFHHSRSDVDGHRHGSASSTGSASSQHHSNMNTTNGTSGAGSGSGGGNSQSTTANGHNGSSDDILSYGVDIKPVSSASAFTPIQSATMLSNARNAAVAAAYFPYDTFGFAKPGSGQVHSMDIKSSMEAKSSGHNSFPNQLIALHQIRNYASMPNSAASLAQEHRILKDKSS